MFKRSVLALSVLAAVPALASGELAVSRLTGTATISHDGKSQPASIKQGLMPGDVIAAGARSRAGLSLGNGGAFTLAGLSELQVFDADKGSAKTPALAKLKLLAGAVRVVSNAGTGKLPQDVRLNVGTLKTRIYGSEAWGASTAEGDTVCLISGAIEIQTSSTEPLERLSEPGACLRRSPEGKVSKLTAAGDAILPAAIAATAFPPPEPLPAPVPPPAMMAKPAAAPVPAPKATTPSPAPAEVAKLPEPKPVAKATKPVPAVKVIPTGPRSDSAVARALATPPPSGTAPGIARINTPQTAPAVTPPPSTQGQILIQTPVQTIVQSTPASKASGKAVKPTEIVKPTAMAKAPATAKPMAPKPAEALAMAKPEAPKASKPASGKGWTVVVSSSSNKAAAESRTAALQDQGFVANLRPAQVNGATTYRLTVGEFATREEAQAYSEHTLAKSGLKGWLSPL